MRCAAISADLAVTVCLVSHSHTQQSATELQPPLLRPAHPDPRCSHLRSEISNRFAPQFTKLPSNHLVNGMRPHPHLLDFTPCSAPHWLLPGPTSQPLVLGTICQTPQMLDKGTY